MLRLLCALRPFVYRPGRANRLPCPSQEPEQQSTPLQIPQYLL